MGLLMERYIGLLGLVLIVGLAWLMSSHKSRFPWRVVVGGLVLQFLFAVVILRSTAGKWLFGWANDVMMSVLACVDAGSSFVFGEAFAEHFFAFKVLPTIIFFSALMSMFYYLGVVQKIVGLFALVMQKTLGTSGAETLSATANVFVGQTEAPLVVRPYISGMTNSELNSVMVGGFATMSASGIGALAEMGIDAGHMISASVISVPGALLLSKIMQPETDTPDTAGRIDTNNKQSSTEQEQANVLEAIAVGTTSGAQLALNIGAMLIVFLALITLLNLLLGWIGAQLGYVSADGSYLVSLDAALGYLFYPVAWLIGIDRADCMTAGELIGLKMATNEFVAYGRLANWGSEDSIVQISERSRIILTYALCGFANFGSIGIQMGGIGGIAPNRQSDLARLGLRAMIAGTMATLMSACIAGLVL